MDKRKFPRRGVSIDAVFNLGEGEGSFCVIKDFSEQGMYITLNDQRYLAAIQSRLAELESMATVTVKLPERYVSIDAVVVHQKGVGLGMKFLNPGAKLNESLVQAAQLATTENTSLSNSEEGKKSYAAAKKSNLVHLTNNRAKVFLEDRFPEFFTGLLDRLIAEADVQKTDAAQHAYFDAIAAFKKNAKRIESSVTSTLLSDASDVANNRYKDSRLQNKENQQTQSLSLVAKEEFEDWLIVRVAISRSELQVREALIELQLRLDAAFGNNEGRVYNPYSPAALCHAFYQSIRPYRLSNKVEKLVFGVLQDLILSHLRVLYKAINRIFIDADILPHIDVTKYLATKALSERPKAAVTNAGNRKETTAVLDPKAKPKQPEQPVQPSTAENIKSIEGAITPVQGNFQQLQVGLQKARSAYSVASNLWQVHRSSHAADEGIERSPRAAPPVATEHQAVDFNQALDHVRAAVLNGDISLDEPGSLKHHLSQASGSQAELNHVDIDAADMMETLFNNIVQNHRIEASLRTDLRKLAIPLLEVMREDPSLFTADFHPTRQTVNYLALLSDKGSINVASNKPVIRESIDRLVVSGARDQGINDQILATLEVLVEKEKKFIERNLSRVTEACAGQEKIKLAQHSVEKELAKRFGAIKVPVALLELIAQGWRELMRLCYLREGIESRAWEMTLIVIDQLIIRLAPSEYDESKVLFKSEELFKLIQKGLSKVAKSELQHSAVLKDLHQLLVDGVKETTQLGQFTQILDVEETINERIVRLGLNDQDKPLQRWIKRASNLKEGQWLEFDSHLEQSSINQLAWVSEKNDRFVFVNHQGMKVLDLAIEELANRLRQGESVILSDASMPAVEKGLDALIQKIYDQLAYESSHDQLTGLITRKEFERCIARAVSTSKKDASEYVLIFLDVLQFKIINSTCGYEVGDKFLAQIAQRITSVCPEDAMIGRVGGSEFGILQSVESEQKGYLLASDIKETVEGERYTSGEQNYVMSTMVSMVSFDRNNEQVLELLRAVEAATEIGKKSGRKEIQVVQPGDQRLEERDEVMSWVTRINQALDDDQLKIRCQMIYPIPTEDDLRPHFEVLLTVVDSNGEHLPPTDFIKAAEEYSRMGAVDRWVIENVLRWMIDNPEVLDEIGGFSINLSGHSLNDETFLDFIFEALVRYQVPRKKLIFEITETTAVANLEDAADFINEMKGIGCRFSLDDFGAGQSSYAYLKRLPVDFIKIDGAFVRNIAEDDVDYALVKSITEMGHFLNKKIVAEYVSDDQILEVVRDIGVDYVQGYYLGKPVMIEEVSGALRPAHEVA